ncbi:MAG: hypothetical protein JW846_06765 [Dehalococcoidia bacterium]|nr:hypothetical protein [Dehalococcoidia bacterium]
MTGGSVDFALEELQSQIRALQQELDETNKGTIALSLELEESREKLARQADELLRANAELESANAELNAFSYSVSHDLRAPLRAVLGFSNVLHEDYGDILGAYGGELLDRIRQAATRMSDLIIDLLRLSRTTTADMRISLVDLSQIANGVVAELQGLEPERSVQVEVQSGLMCEADLHLIRIVLENLIGNAWKFTSGNDTPYIEVSAESGSDACVYCVKDNGAGFDMDYASKLFGPFQRLHTEEEYPGTGIGLATVRAIVRRHGGEVWAHGEIGKGAAFYFTLSPSGSVEAPRND